MNRTAIRTIVCLGLCGIMATPPATAQPPFGRPHGPMHRGHGGPGRGPVVINNFNNDNSGFVASALGFGAGMLIGSAVAQPPVPQTSTVIVTQPVAPPVIVAQPAPSVIMTQPVAPPVIVAQPAPSVIMTQPVPSVTTVVAQPAPVDGVAEALKLTQSHWAHKRRDGAMLLGRLKAGQGVGPLLDLLRNDKSADVRKSAAWALAEIGDSNALDYLGKASQYDKSAEVRAAAGTAYQRLVDKVAVVLPNETSLKTATQTTSQRRMNQAPPLPPTPGQSPPTTGERRKSSLSLSTPSSTSSSDSSSTTSVSPFARPNTNAGTSRSSESLPPVLVPPNEPLNIP